MSKIKIIEIKESIFADNAMEADQLRAQLKAQKTFLLNVMSSPGSGKTTLLLRTLEALKEKYRIGIMEADIDSEVDAAKIVSAGGTAIQLHTGGMCHMDASMTQAGLRGIKSEHFDAVILENVGNLVCPAEFDTGASKSIEILSVPEGDDKPLKYPLMFTVCDAVIVSKMDCQNYFDFDLDALEERVHRLNPHAVVIPLSAKTGEGLQAWIEWLSAEIDAWNE